MRKQTNLNVFELPKESKCNPKWVDEILCKENELDNNDLAKMFLENIRLLISSKYDRNDLLQHFYTLNQWLCMDGFACCIMEKAEEYPDVLKFFMSFKKE